MLPSSGILSVQLQLVIWQIYLSSSETLGLHIRTWSYVYTASVGKHVTAVIFRLASTNR